MPGFRPTALVLWCERSSTWTTICSGPPLAYSGAARGCSMRRLHSPLPPSPLSSCGPPHGPTSQSRPRAVGTRRRSPAWSSGTRSQSTTWWAQACRMRDRHRGTGHYGYARWLLARGGGLRRKESSGLHLDDLLDGHLPDHHLVHVLDPLALDELLHRHRHLRTPA